MTVLAIAIILVLTLAAVGAHSVLVAPWAVRVTEVEAAIADLPAAFRGFTIVVLADIHHRPVLSRGASRRALDAVLAAKPDLVALLGDYGVSYKYVRFRTAFMYERGMRELTPLLARVTGRHPTVAVLGNHDHYYSAERTRGWLESLGARVLVNESIRIERDGATLVVGGVDDVVEGRVDPGAGCAGQPNEVPTVVLSHSPDGAVLLSTSRRVDLVLSGHTHGGQVVFPFYGAPLRMARICGRHTASHWVPNPRAPLFVSRGVGGQIPLRFNCPPEVVVVRLVEGQR